MQSSQDPSLIVACGKSSSEIFPVSYCSCRRSGLQHKLKVARPPLVLDWRLAPRLKRQLKSTPHASPASTWTPQYWELRLRVSLLQRNFNETKHNFHKQIFLKLYFSLNHKLNLKVYSGDDFSESMGDSTDLHDKLVSTQFVSACNSQW